MARPAARRVTLVTLSLSLALAAPRAALAQRPDSLPAGVRIRVTQRFHAPPPRILVGTLVRADTAELVLAPSGGAPAAALALAGVRAVEVSEGLQPRDEAFARGATTGFLVGAAVGLVATGLAYRADRRAPCDCMFSGTVVVGALGVAVAGVSAVVGGALAAADPERWRQVWPAR